MSRAARLPSPSASTTIDGPRMHVAADEDVALDPAVLVRGDDPAASLRCSGSQSSCWTWPIAIRIVSQMTSRSVPGISSGRTAPLSSLASRASQSTAPVTCPSCGQHPDQRGVRGEQHALVPGLLQVLGDDQQLVFGLQRDDGGRAAAQPDRRPGRVRGGVAAADDQHLAAHLDRAAQAGLAEELQAAADAAGLDPLDRQPLAHVLAEGEERRG